MTTKKKTWLLLIDVSGGIYVYDTVQDLENAINGGEHGDEGDEVIDIILVQSVKNYEVIPPDKTVIIKEIK
jgi:hypothetical protein